MAVTTDHGRSKGRRAKTKGIRYPEVDGPDTAVQMLADDQDDHIDTDVGVPPEHDEPTTEEAVVSRPLALQRALRDVEASVDSSGSALDEGVEVRHPAK